MANTDIQPDEVGAEIIPAQAPKTRRALSKLKRELSEEELGSPGVQKMILETLESVEDERDELKGFRDDFHKCDKQRAILEAKLKTNGAIEAVSMASLAVGAAAIGYAPSLWGTQPGGFFALGFGVVLTIVGIVAKVVRS